MDPARENDWAALPQAESHPWDPLPDETPPAFKAFCIFRDSPSEEQSHRAISLKIYGSLKERQRISQWSARYRWADRTKAYIQHNADLEQAAIQAALLEERKQAARERLETGRLAVRKVRERLEAIGAENDALPAGVLAALLKAGADLARIEDGESTDRVEGVLSWKELIESASE